MRLPNHVVLLTPLIVTPVPYATIAEMGPAATLTLEHFGFVIIFSLCPAPSGFLGFVWTPGLLVLHTLVIVSA